MVFTVLRVHGCALRARHLPCDPMRCPREIRQCHLQQTAKKNVELGTCLAIETMLRHYADYKQETMMRSGCQIRTEVGGESGSMTRGLDQLTVSDCIVRTNVF
jgi:hypothetical protein